MKKFLTNLGRFTTKLVSLLVICGFISLACLPIVYALNDDVLDGNEECHAPSVEGEQPGIKTRNGSGEEAEDQISDGVQNGTETPTDSTTETTTEEKKDSETTSGGTTSDENATTTTDDDGEEEGDGGTSSSTTEGGTTPSDEGDEENPGTDPGTTPNQPETPVEYTVTFKYISTEESDKLLGTSTLVCKAGKYRFVPKGVFDGYTPKKESESVIVEIGEDQANEVSFSYEKIVTEVTLTVVCKFDDGTPDRVCGTYDYAIGEKYEIGKQYKISSPEVDGYTPAEAEIEFTLEENATAEMTYTKNSPDQPDPIKCTVTIKYQNEAGEKIADDKTEERLSGEQTFKADKDIPGYITPSREEKITVTGDRDKDIVIFTYERASATLTIHYVKDDGSEAVKDYIASVKIGDSYAVESPQVANYTPDPDQAIIKGTMTAAGATYTVTYTRNSPDAPIEYTVTIHYRDAEDKDGTGEEIAPSTTQVCKAGECVIKDDKYIDITGYITPAKGDKITVQVDTSFTLYYEKAPASNPENPGNEPGADEPGADDPKDPTNPDNQDPNGQDPANQQPADQKPNNQQPGTQTPTITLPVTGPSDELIRNFLVLDAEVSTGGIGLWAVSGIIRKIRRR